MRLSELDRYIKDFLQLEKFERADSSLNGVQVGLMDEDIRRIAFGVDACMAGFERAAAGGAQLLFVHHGLFWGTPLAVTEQHYRRVRYLMEHSLALYAAHLPLDAHPEVGNNAGLADLLGLEERKPWGTYKGLEIGFKGRLPRKMTLDAVLEKLDMRRDECAGFLSFGPELVETVGIISGGASYEVADAITDGLDLYLTGEMGHSIYHLCAEAGMNMIAGGHYRTETLGVQQLAKRIQSDLGLETFFADVPTGL